MNVDNQSDLSGKYIRKETRSLFHEGWASKKVYSIVTLLSHYENQLNSVKVTQGGSWTRMGIRVQEQYLTISAHAKISNELNYVRYGLSVCNTFRVSPPLNMYL